MIFKTPLQLLKLHTNHIAGELDGRGFRGSSQVGNHLHFRRPCGLALGLSGATAQQAGARWMPIARADSHDHDGATMAGTRPSRTRPPRSSSASSTSASTVPLPDPEGCAPLRSWPGRETREGPCGARGRDGLGWLRRDSWGRGGARLPRGGAGSTCAAGRARASLLQLRAGLEARAAPKRAGLEARAAPKRAGLEALVAESPPRCHLKRALLAQPSSLPSRGSHLRLATSPAPPPRAPPPHKPPPPARAQASRTRTRRGRTRGGGSAGRRARGGRTPCGGSRGGRLRASSRTPTSSPRSSSSPSRCPSPARRESEERARTARACMRWCGVDGVVMRA
jgi:hypothetical protein